MKKELPKVVHQTAEEINALLQQIRMATPSWSAEQRVLAEECVTFTVWLPMELQGNRITMHRLRTLIFGKSYTQNNQSNTSGPLSTPAASNDEADNAETVSVNTEAVEPATAQTPKQKKKPGHGRMPHTVYKNCKEVEVALNELVAGMLCPNQCGGRLQNYKPGAVIRITGQNIAQATRYVIEKLRCSTCLDIFSATLPPEAGDEKYDASFKAMMALMKYYVAVPFYRQEYFQGLLGFPLSDSTQWDLIENLAGYCYPIFNALKHCAAQGTVIHNDDSHVKILEVIAKIKTGLHEGRTGMYTTGILAHYQSHQIALFINGTQHAGENLEALLKKRSVDQTPIIQMCDGLKANIPKGLETILCNCLSHGFRKFKELEDYFERECVVILQALGHVFKVDEQTRTMDVQTRLLHHQTHSRPVLEELRLYMEALINTHQVEPNSELGKAIVYMQKRWEALTRFLTVAGAPVDNNILERALKIAIRNRKNALFYRTCYSAHIGGMLTSLIYTCHLARENPLAYLVVLQKNAQAVLEAPEQWLPWNYRESQKELT